MTLDLIRAWKDESYREGLTSHERALLPQNPAGAIELTEDELASIDGGMLPISYTTLTPTISVLLSCRAMCI